MANNTMFGRTSGGDYKPMRVDDNGIVQTGAGGGSGGTTATGSAVAAATASTTLIAANTSRAGASVFNNSSADLYLKMGTAAGATSFTAILGGSAYWETPFGYKGIITGAWASAAGSAHVSEVV